MSDSQEKPVEKVAEKAASDSTPELREHVYDGIQEFDNKMPNWWLWSFYIMVIIYVVYWVAYYQGGGFDTIENQVEARLDEIAEIQAAAIEESVGVVDDEKLWELSQNAEFVAKGKTNFMQSCVACHAADLSGMIGEVKLPGVPLNDKAWLYGGTPMEVMKIIAEGSPDKKSGMQAWGPIVGDEKVIEIVAFVMSHHKKGEEITQAEK